MSKVTVTQFDGDRKAIIYCNFRIASSTAETFVINVANLVKNKNGDACTSLAINKAWWSVNNTAVTKTLELLWGGSNDLALACNFAEDQDWSSIGGLKNPKSGGHNGNIEVIFTSTTTGDTATIVLEVLKNYN